VTYNDVFYNRNLFVMNPDQTTSKTMQGATAQLGRSECL